MGKNRLGLKYRGCRINVRRIDVVGNRLRRGRRRTESAVHGNLEIVFNLLLQLIDSLFVKNAFANQKHLHARDGIARRIALTFGVWPIETLVIGQGMRIGADDMRVDESRARSRAAMGH